jgi:O-antigen/teichoic acid export membrane protein
LKNVLIYLFRAWERNRPAIVAEGMASLILLAGAYPVIQTWSALGLAVLVLVAQASSTAFLLVWFMRYTKIGIRRLAGNWRDTATCLRRPRR